MSMLVPACTVIDSAFAARLAVDPCRNLSPLLCASARPARALHVRRRVASARGAKRLWRESIFLVGALKRRPRPRKKRSELIRETSAPLWGQNVPTFMTSLPNRSRQVWSIKRARKKRPL